MKWSLYKGEKFLKPLCFSNGKTQEDIVREVLDAFDKEENIVFIHGICGTGKCLDKDSLIFCKPKEENFYSYYKISELEGKEGSILSLDKKGKIIQALFKNVRKTGRKKIYRMITRTGRDINASLNHPFLSITNKGLEWIPLEKLDNSSYICLSNRVNIEENCDLGDDEIKILAHLIAEGKLGDKVGSPKYYQCASQNPKIRQDYIFALKSFFPEGEVKEKDSEVTIKFGLRDTTKGTTNKLRLLIRKHGLDGKKSKDKFVPKAIFGLNKGKVALFLSRLFSGDGCIYERKNQIVVEYTSISKRLIQDVSILLHRFGIHHTISFKGFRDVKEYSWRISISNHNNLKKYIKKIGFVGRKQDLALKLLEKLKDHKFTNIDKVPRKIREYLKERGYSYLELDRFLNYDEIIENRKIKNFKSIRADREINTPYVFNQSKIDFLRLHIRKINEKIKDPVLSFVSSEDIIWDKIKSINYEKEDETYDLEVSETHNFICNGIITHNSAIALNIAKEMGKTSIVVPGKNLQNQYKKDYASEKHLKNKSGEKLKISIITGRKNHKCKFLQDNLDAIPKINKEVNLNLHDIFEGKREEAKNLAEKDFSADNFHLPCKIEIKEKNWQRIKEYLNQNPKININNFGEIKNVKRLSIAPVCPYWSPVLPDSYDAKTLGKVTKRSYQGLNGTTYVFHQRTPGCGFYEQFNYYIDSDVIVFNSMKYKLETALNRKPLTEVEIIDECDEFLDSFANQREINLDRLQNALIHEVTLGGTDDYFSEEIFTLIKHLRKNPRIEQALKSKEVIPLRETGLYDLLKIFLKKEFIENIEDESYIFETVETARMFEDFLDESYVSFSKVDNNFIVNLVTINLAKRLEELINKNKRIVLMSGTLHSDNVLRTIFGLDKFKVVDAETEHQGRIDIVKTGLEMDCKYSNFSSGKFNREDYLRALDKCLDVAKKPTLIHVNAFKDLPTSEEISKYNLNNLISKDEVRDMQRKDGEGKILSDFKSGNIDILFSTRDSRGVDFPGEECNSIVFTKYPNPDIQNPFWKILNKSKPQYYWSFYKDKARRELLQKLYRGLRFKEDHVFVLSPDVRVLDFFDKIGVFES